MIAGRAVIVDLPGGSASDPPERRGLAALAARHLADPAAGGPGTLASRRGWRTRHRLEPDWSSFSFWSCVDDDIGDVAAAFEHVQPPGRAGLAALVDRQSRLANAHRANGYLRLMDLLDGCAWGEQNNALGTAATLASITTDDLQDYFDACQDRVSPLASPATRQWRGGYRSAPQPGDVTRVAVAVPVTGSAPGAVELAVEMLGSHGMGGRLGSALRSDRAIAYGLGAFRLGSGQNCAIAAQAQVAPEHTVEAGRLLMDCVRSVLHGPVDERERLRAATRVRTALLLQVDQPFGAADEARRKRLRVPTLVDLATAVQQRGRDGVLPTEEPGLPSAVVALGAVTPEQSSALERTHT
ncbi:hypothetical protein ALI144C_16990 [Actinosynnema sp. ALI-1.44]|uniref:insulinase family protein n=1 Tax=Actinosynnema sp. ALI-1.44 TaxID=1933779 RepID=UPI00097BA914|nr:insulinase family protein [Actinosynnema sp. ALI-1.44]ONI83192.1 hypothetical protein ALI144C_16990 [Actinosynnema sp. ALI-1.44]